MKEVATHNTYKFEIIKDFSEVGFYLHVYDEKNNCIKDYLQDSQDISKEIALKEFGVPINSWEKVNEVMCCFCGEGLYFDESIRISLAFPNDDQELQGFFSHKKCTNKVLHKDVVRHPGIFERSPHNIQKNINPSF